MVNITVEESTRPFNCPAGWTVNKAEVRIRSMYGLIHGGIERNGEAADPADLIQEGFKYVFVGGQSAPQAQGKGHKYLISKLSPNEVFAPLFHYRLFIF
jgi:hypothetical protein